MADMITVTCANERCGKTFDARLVDVQRGWGRYCSKSCAMMARMTNESRGKSGPINKKPRHCTGATHPLKRSETQR
jgi:hypothetical protein